MKKVFIISLLLLLSATVISTGLVSKKTHAVSGSDWQAGNIVSDLMFTNSNDMSVSDIQAFLNSQNPNCDTNGTKPATEYGRSDLTHAQYAAMRGWSPPPYICLRNYYEVPKYSPAPGIPANNFSGSIPAGAVSAAQIIYDAAQKNNINPKVLLVKIGTESAGPLTSDTWPMQSQYTYAMGSHCPDSGPGGSANCDGNYAGFSMQVESGAELIRYYLDNMEQPWWTYKKPYQTNSVLWNVAQTGCGAGDVYIQGKATAALYTYTPYQPNAAALANVYGLGDGCSAYGNRNFWRVWNDWFGSTQNEPNLLSFKSQLSYLGWTNPIKNHGITGTIGQSRPMEAFRIDGDVNYSSYSYSTGWQPTVSNGMISGTTAISRPIQALRVSLGSSLSSQYDIWYRTQESYIGWMGWAKNGDPAGVSGGQSNDIEAFEIQIMPKGSNPPGDTTNAYQNINTITYSPPLLLQGAAQVGYVGWEPTLTNDMTLGTTEQDKRIEALTLNLVNNTGIPGSITYAAQLAYLGWQPFVSNGVMAGTTGQSRQMETIRIALTGELGAKYDIWYRGFIKYAGWQGWAKNGEAAGSIGAGLQLEGLDIHIVPKGTGTFIDQGGLYNPRSIAISPLSDINYSVHESNVGWVSGFGQNDIGGTVGQSRPLEAVRFDNLTSVLGSSDISCSVYSRGIGWTAPTSVGNTCGTTGQSRPIESIKLSLTGDIASRYDLVYKTQLSYLGWQDWTSNGSQSGTPDTGHNIEAIMVKLVPKS